MIKTMWNAALILAVGFSACANQSSENKQQAPKPSANQTTNNMNSFISIFEIPATDISRAINFYKSILDIQIEQMDMPGMKMGIFPYEQQMVTGVIVEGEGYKPSSDGVTIYLNAGKDLTTILDKVEKNGGKIVIPKTLHGDESGYFAVFTDTEGNKLGLHSPN